MADVNLSISKEVVEPIVREKIRAMVEEAIGDPRETIDALVHVALTTKVDERGNVNQDRYYNKYPFLEQITRVRIMEFARQAALDYIKEHEEAIRAAVREELKKSEGELARLLVAGATSAANQPWRFQVQLVPAPPKE